MAQFNMPELGETVSEGTITRWLKKEGDPIEADEALLEVSTDKVDSEIPAPQSGTLTRILVQEGETVAVGVPVAEIAPTEDSVSTEGPGDARPPAEEAGIPDFTPAETQSAHGPASAGTGGDRAPGDGAGEEREPAAKVLSPLVRKLAAQKKVDLSKVRGTGSAGRITRDDVLRHAGEGNGSAAPSVRPAAAGAVGPASARPPAAEASAGREASGLDERIPLSNMRRLIAEHMVASVNETARAWNTVEVDMSAVGRLRKAAGASFKRAYGYSLTWTPFVARALTQALLEFPQVNSSWNGDNTITRKHYVNLGIAVALENGLIVPVVKGADQMNLVGLAASIRDVAERARNKKLTADEIKQGTFTLTNPGPFGSVMSVPIINRGEAAILAFDSIVKRPVVVTDREGRDSIGIREMVYLSLSWDHRLIDGAEAAQFLSRLKAILEEADFEADLAAHLGIGRAS